MAESNADFLKRQFGGGSTAVADPNAEFLKSMFGGGPTSVAPGPREAKDIGDSIIAGLQSSSLGLAVRGKLPDQQLPENAPWYHRAAAGVGGLIGDAPAMIAGAVGGSAAGTAVAPGAGTLIGGGAGAFAVPMAIRDGLIAAYNNNHALSWAGVWDIASAALKGGGKGAVLGAATAGAGAVVGRVAGSVVAPSVGISMTGQTAARVIEGTAAGAELATLTGTAAALDGRMPTWQDFMDNAILLGGMKGAVAVAKGMRNVYAETGRTPEQMLADATKDPAIKAALEEGKMPAAYEPHALAERITAALNPTDVRPEQIRESLTNLSPGSNTPKLDGNLLTDPVKYEYITDSATAAGVLRTVTELYQNEIAKQTRGEVPNKQTAAEALKMIAGGGVSDRVIGEAGNAAEIYARAHLLKGATNFAISELGKIADVPPGELTPSMKLSALAALQQVAMLKAELEGVGAEAGRALQIFRAMKRDPSFLGEADVLIKAAERKGNLQDVARFARTLKDPAQLAEFARQYAKATTMEKFIEAWKAGVLSGPLTTMANMAGNLTKWFVEIPEHMIAATLTAAQRKIQGDPLTMAQFKARAFAPLIGLELGAKDGLITAGEVLKQEGTHLEKADVYRTAIEGRAGTVIRLPFRFLQAQDVLFRTPAERAKAYELAVDRVVKEGLHPDTVEGQHKIAEYTGRPELGLSEAEGKKALALVEEAGGEAVFAQRLGPRMEMLQRAMAGHWSSLIVPFVRTPANLVSWAVQHTPGLNLASARWREDFAAGGEARNRALSRIVIGTGLAVTAFGMAQNGTLTGGGLFDKEQGGTKHAAGWQPYSVMIGDKFYSYQRIEPVAKVLGIAADLVEMIHASKDGEDKSKMAAMLVLMFGNATISTTYLSGLANAVQSITDPTRYGQNFLEQYATSLVPKIIGQTVTMADPYKREVEGVIDAVQSQLPFLREKLLPKRDVWGEPAPNHKWFNVMPVQVTQVSKDLVRTEAERLQVAIADAPKFVLERGPFQPKERRTELSIEQRDIFKQVAGHNAMEILSPIVNDPDWKNIPDFAKAEIYRKVIEGTRKQGQFAALPPDAESRQQLREKLLDKIIRQTESVK